MIKVKVHTNFWYISPLLAFSAYNKYLSLGLLCFSVFLHFKAEDKDMLDKLR